MVVHWVLEKEAVAEHKESLTEKAIDLGPQECISSRKRFTSTHHSLKIEESKLHTYYILLTFKAVFLLEQN